MVITERELGQVRAALRVWIALAERSARHPCWHPAARKELAHNGPLEIEEIEELLTKLKTL